MVAQISQASAWQNGLALWAEVRSLTWAHVAVRDS